MTGKELREKRKKFKLTQQELASQLGISYATISRWERGEYEPHPSYEEMLKNFFVLLEEKQQTLQQIEQPTQRRSFRRETIGERLERELFKDIRREEIDIVKYLLEEAIDFYPPTGILDGNLKYMINQNAQQIQNDISSGRIGGGTMLRIRSNTIASAMLDEDKDVAYWAREGMKWCQDRNRRELLGAWAYTMPEWQWIINNEEQYIELVIKVKRFLNHIVDSVGFTDDDLKRLMGGGGVRKKS